MVAFKEEIEIMSFDHEDIMKRAKRNKRPPKERPFRTITGMGFFSEPVRLRETEIRKDLAKPFEDFTKEILSM